MIFGLVLDPPVVGMAAAAAIAFAVMAVIIAKLATQAAEERAAGAAALADGTRKVSRRFDDAYKGSAVLQRAIELTANLAERRGVLGSVERSLRAADIPMRPAEVIFAYVVVAVVVPLSSLLFLRSTKLVLLSIVVFAVLPPYALRLIVKGRRKKFVGQLPDALTTLSGSLRAGRSLGQALEALAREVPAPMGRELRKIVAEVRLGRRLSDALDDAVERMGSPDFRWAVLAVQIQAEVGGNLAELLDRVAETMRGRSRLRGEVKALTAEGRASAGMLIVMPPALGGVMYAVNPAYMKPLFTETIGHAILGISTVMMLIGFLWMKKVVTIDV
ncbi:MAG: tight adherence protein [Acidimicrobiaceae bacterium]|jgi:tight adherence protein B